MSKKYRLYFAIGITVFLLSSCGEYDILTIEKESKRVSDSLFRAHKDSLSKVIDTLCQINHDKLFKQYFDSLTIVEGERIKELIKK